MRWSPPGQQWLRVSRGLIHARRRNRSPRGQTRSVRSNRSAPGGKYTPSCRRCCRKCTVMPPNTPAPPRVIPQRGPATLTVSVDRDPPCSRMRRPRCWPGRAARYCECAPPVSSAVEKAVLQNHCPASACVDIHGNGHHCRGRIDPVHKRTVFKPQISIDIARSRDVHEQRTRVVSKKAEISQSTNLFRVAAASQRISAVAAERAMVSRPIVQRSNKFSEPSFRNSDEDAASSPAVAWPIPAMWTL